MRLLTLLALVALAYRRSFLFNKKVETIYNMVIIFVFAPLAKPSTDRKMGILRRALDSIERGTGA